MSGVIDLDPLAAEPREVNLAGTIYLLPGDLPIPTMIRLERYSERIGTAAEDATEAETQEANRQNLLALYEEVLKLFQVYQPTLEDLPIQTSQLVPAINQIYGDAAQEAEETDPTVPPSGKTKKKTASRARSRAS